MTRTDKIRNDIITVIGDEARTFGEIQDVIKMSKSGLAYHLEAMRRDGIISFIARGSWYLYKRGSGEKPKRGNNADVVRVVLNSDGPITVNEAAQATGKSRNTVKDALNSAFNRGIIDKTRRDNAVAYMPPQESVAQMALRLLSPISPMISMRIRLKNRESEWKRLNVI